MLGTHLLTDRLWEAPPQWEALVWTHVAGHSQEEGSPMLLLQPVLSFDPPQGPHRSPRPTVLKESDWLRNPQGVWRVQGLEAETAAF